MRKKAFALGFYDGRRTAWCARWDSGSRKNLANHVKLRAQLEPMRDAPLNGWLILRHLNTLALSPLSGIPQHSAEVTTRPRNDKQVPDEVAVGETLLLLTLESRFYAVLSKAA